MTSRRKRKKKKKIAEENSLQSSEKIHPVDSIILMGSDNQMNAKMLTFSRKRKKTKNIKPKARSRVGYRQAYHICTNCEIFLDDVYFQEVRAQTH